MAIQLAALHSDDTPQRVAERICILQLDRSLDGTGGFLKGLLPIRSQLEVQRISESKSKGNQCHGAIRIDH